MRRIVIVLVLFLLPFLVPQSPSIAQPPVKARLLYMTLTKGFHHESIELSKQIVKELGDKSGAFETTVTEDIGAFTADNLKNYDVVMFNTTGELPMTDQQKKDFMGFIRGGKGFVGVHSATDTFYMWSDYGEMIGGYFNGHPWHELVTIDVADTSSAITGSLGKSFQINDEIYQVSDFQARDTHVLLRLDPASVKIDKPGVMHRYYGWPVAWTRSWGKGRVYYNGLGHDDWVWKDSRYQDMLLNGIKWAIGGKK